MDSSSSGVRDIHSLNFVPKLPPLVASICIAIAFFVTGFAVYGPSLGNDFVSWDDLLLIVDNPNVHEISTTTVKNVFTSYDPELYIPLTFLSYQIDDAIGGGTPFMFHLTNLILHVLNSLLVAWFMYAVLKRGWLALGLGLVFLVHPLNTEAVVWASSRKDVLSTFFFFASLLTWMHYRASEKKTVLVSSVSLFVLGALSKVMVVTMPVIMVMIDLLEGKPFDRTLLKGKVPYIAVSVIFGCIAIFGKARNLVISTTLQKLFMACKATVFYLMKFFFPWNLSPMYPYTKSITPLSPDFFIPVIIMITLFGVVWMLRKKQLVVFGIIFFFVTLTPTFTNFAKGGDMYFASDRYAYIPMAGLLIVIGAIVKKWLEDAGGVRAYISRRTTVLGLLVILIATYGYGSVAQAARWKDNATLYAYVLSLYPNARAARNNMGMEYYMTGQYDDAIREFDAASAIHPDPKTTVNRAAALVAKGSLDEAMSEYRNALSLVPDFPDAFYGIGNIHQKRGQLAEAAAQYRKTLQVAPHFTNALNNLGAVYIMMEDWDRAIETLQKSIEMKPDFAESYYNLAGAYERKGMMSEAKAMYREAIRMNPGNADALANLASLVYDDEKIDEAAQLLMRSLEIDSSNPSSVALVLRMRKDGVAK